MRNKILALTVLAASAIGVAEAAPVRTWVFGVGNAQDTDRQSAVSQATDAATDQVNAICIGVVTTVERTSTICLGGGDDPYSCIVTVKALCQLHR